jgi:hypothetical protein
MLGDRSKLYDLGQVNFIGIFEALIQSPLDLSRKSRGGRWSAQRFPDYRLIGVSTVRGQVGASWPMTVANRRRIDILRAKLRGSSTWLTSRSSDVRWNGRSLRLARREFLDNLLSIIDCKRDVVHISDNPSTRLIA